MGYQVIEPKPDKRPVCCGRTFLASGMIDRAKKEATGFVATLEPYVRQGIPIVGLEPSCLLTLRDEFSVLLDAATADVHRKTCISFRRVYRERTCRRTHKLNLSTAKCSEVTVHGHCHQKAARVMGPVRVPA